MDIFVNNESKRMTFTFYSNETPDDILCRLFFLYWEKGNGWTKVLRHTNEKRQFIEEKESEEEVLDWLNTHGILLDEDNMFYECLHRLVKVNYSIADACKMLGKKLIE